MASVAGGCALAAGAAAALGFVVYRMPWFLVARALRMTLEKEAQWSGGTKMLSAAVHRARGAWKELVPSLLAWTTQVTHTNECITALQKLRTVAKGSSSSDELDEAKAWANLQVECYVRLVVSVVGSVMLAHRLVVVACQTTAQSCAASTPAPPNETQKVFAALLQRELQACEVWLCHVAKLSRDAITRSRHGGGESWVWDEALVERNRWCALLETAVRTAWQEARSEDLYVGDHGRSMTVAEAAVSDICSSSWFQHEVLEQAVSKLRRTGAAVHAALAPASPAVQHGNAGTQNGNTGDDIYKCDPKALALKLPKASQQLIQEVGVLGSLGVNLRGSSVARGIALARETRHGTIWDLLDLLLDRK